MKHGASLAPHCIYNRSERLGSANEQTHFQTEHADENNWYGEQDVTRTSTISTTQEDQQGTRS